MLLQATRKRLCAQTVRLGIDWVWCFFEVLWVPWVSYSGQKKENSLDRSKNCKLSRFFIIFTWVGDCLDLKS